MSKISFKTKVISTLLSLLLILQLLSLTALAGSPYSVIDLTTGVGQSGDGYSYDAGNNVLTISASGASLTSGIILPDGAKIQLDGDLTITSEAVCIYSQGEIAITGSGALSLTNTTGSSAISTVGDMNIDITGDILAYTDGDSISSGGDIYIKTMGNLNVNSEDGWNYAVKSTAGDITLIVYGNLEVMADGYGIYGTKDVNLYVYGNTKISDHGMSSSGDAVYGDDIYYYNEGEFHVVCTLKAFYATNSIVIDGSGSFQGLCNRIFYSEGSVEIKGTSTITADRLSVAKTTFTVEESVSFNGVYAIDDGITCDFYILGNYEPDGTPLPTDTSTVSHIYFLPGTTLTLCSSDKFNLSGAIVDYTNVTIVNNDGKLTVNDVAEVLAANTSGSGYFIDATGAYDINGTAVYIGDDINLDENPVDNEYYKWEQNVDGVWVFTPKTHYFECAIYVKVTNSIFYCEDDIIINGTLVPFYTMSEGGQTFNPTNFTISGGGKLTVAFIYDVTFDFTLTVDTDTTLLTYGIIPLLLDNEYMPIDINVIVDGNLEMYLLSATNLTVNNGGTVSVIEFFALINQEGKPGSLVLGDEVMTLTPLDGKLYTTLSEGTLFASIFGNSNTEIQVFTTDGEEVGADKSNIATAVEFGVGTYHDITLTINGNGTATPNSDVNLLYGSEQTYEFTPDEGYFISDVKVDGVSVGAVSSYTFDYITDDASIEVTFEEIEIIPEVESDLADTGVDTNIAFVIALMLTSLAVLVKIKKTAK